MQISCCGLNCQACDAFLATQRDDEALRAATAEKWTQMYNLPMKPEDIHCTGCQAPGVKIGHCELCAVRQCCMERGHAHCGVCPDYACDTLDGFLGQMPAEMAAANRERLES
jgi:hypothetical protein